MSVARVNDLHKALEVMHKEVADNSQMMRTISQQSYKANASVFSFNCHIGDYVVMHSTNARHRKLNTGWIGQMRIADANSDLVLVVDDLHKARSFKVHAQQLTPYEAHYSGTSIQVKLLENVE